MDDEKSGQEKTVPSYWAVLPSPIRYNPKLSSSAKVLYAELSSLTQSYGYCWADNDYFCRLYGITERTVIRLLGLLEETGCIRIEGGGTTKRRIFCGINPLADAAAIEAPARREQKKTTDKNVTATDKNVSAGDKNVTAIYNTEMDQENGTIPPKAPKGAGAEIWDKPAWDRFWALYPRKVDKAKAIRAWNRLKADRKLMQIMSAALKAQRASDEWRRDNGRAIPYPSTWLNNRRWEDETVSSPAPAPYGGREEEVEWV